MAEQDCPVSGPPSREVFDRASILAMRGKSRYLWSRGNPARTIHQGIKKVLIAQCRNGRERDGFFREQAGAMPAVSGARSVVHGPAVLARRDTLHPPVIANAIGITQPSLGRCDVNLFLCHIRLLLTFH